MDELVELLSLSNFESDKAYEPFLNTPRSLQACRINGVNPIELVEIPVSEFQKDFPNDPDAVQRRFERVDGARKRILVQVTRDWKTLCANGWEPPLDHPKMAQETIVQVSASAHCKLLEIQAQRFRKMEKDNWDALNRQLMMELRQADMEQKNKKITQKHHDIQNSNDGLKKERQLQREELHREQLERQKKKEEEEMLQIKYLQELDQTAAKDKKALAKQNKVKEKQFRERREMERVQRQAYTIQLKNSIVSGVENRIDAKKKMLEVQDKSMMNRLEQRRLEKERHAAQKRQERDERVVKAREDQRVNDEEEKREMMERIQGNQAKRQQIMDSRERERLASSDLNDNAAEEKRLKIKQHSDDRVNGKADRTQEAMNKKEELARQELEKVREAQEKRRTIKAIRQEAFTMAHMRAKKAAEYKMLKMTADVRNKEERCAAIKKGFFALDHMRNSMKDIMEKTNSELKLEMHRLRHKDMFDPDRVVERAIEVGNHVLFPRLERTFGIVSDNMGAGFGLGGGGADLFPAAFDGGSTRAKSASDQFGSLEIIPPRTGTGAPTTADTAALTATTGAVGGESSPKKDGGHGRKGFAPLPIQAMTADRLQDYLLKSKNRILLAEEAEDKAKTASKAWAKSVVLKETRVFNDYDSDPEDEPDRARAAILKLSEDSVSPAPSGKSTAQFPSPLPDARNTQSRAGTGSRRAGRSRGAAGDSQGGRAEGGRAEDVKLPLFKFDPLADSSRGAGNGDACGDPRGSDESEGIFPESKLDKAGIDAHAASQPSSPTAQDPQASDSPQPLSRKVSHLLNQSAKEIRTDVNDKASFLEPPPGKFRREFSNDHPLAKGGTGKYSKELKQGITPAYMHLEQSKEMKSNVSQSLDAATKIEKLTYTAQRRVVDPKSKIDELKKQQNAILKTIIVEERDAELQREHVLRSVTDPRERKNIESVFSEERSRASNRILTATREHEETIKQTVLQMMDLGNMSMSSLQ